MTAMRYRRIIAAALCLTLLCGTGCSLGKKKDSSSSVSAEIGYSYSSSKKTKYEFMDFTFELSDDFTVEDKNTYPQDGTPYDFFLKLVNGNQIIYPILVLLMFFGYIALFYGVYFLVCNRKKRKQQAA